MNLGFHKAVNDKNPRLLLQVVLHNFFIFFLIHFAFLFHCSKPVLRAWVLFDVVERLLGEEREPVLQALHSFLQSVALAL